MYLVFLRTSQLLITFLISSINLLIISYDSYKTYLIVLLSESVMYQISFCSLRLNPIPETT